MEILSDVYHRDCMKIRNARLAELGDVCVCCYNPKRTYGGTFQTVRIAESLGREIINLFS